MGSAQKVATPQAREVVGPNVLNVLGVLHHRFQEGDTSLEDLDAVAGDGRGEATGRGEQRGALRQDASHARRERAGDHVTLAGDPTGIGDDVNDITRPGVERDSEGLDHSGKPAAVDVHHALGFAGRARCVDDEAWELGVQRYGRGAGPDGAHEIGVT